MEEMSLAELRVGMMMEINVFGCSLLGNELPLCTVFTNNDMDGCYELIGALIARSVNLEGLVKADPNSRPFT